MDSYIFFIDGVVGETGSENDFHEYKQKLFSDPYLHLKEDLSRPIARSITLSVEWRRRTGHLLVVILSARIFRTGNRIGNGIQFH